MTRPRIVLDIDSTVWKAEEEYDKASIELYGKRWYDDDSPHDWYDEADLVERYGPDYRRIFARALDPESVEARELYPHVVSALHEIADAYRITFVTHHHAPTTMRSALREWLDTKLSVPFSLHVYTSRVSKADKARTLGAGIIVDDKPQTIREAVDAKLAVLTKLHPWSHKVAEHSPFVVGFNDWNVVPRLVGNQHKAFGRIGCLGASYKQHAFWVENEITGCWEWMGRTNGRGYGSVTINGEAVYVHRAAYEKWVEPIPLGKSIDHLCSNRGCANPQHLEPVTNKVNSWRGAKSKLNPSDVIAIRTQADKGTPQKVIAAEFGIAQPTVSNILAHRRWVDV